MIYTVNTSKHNFYSKFLSFVLIITFLSSSILPPSYAQSIFHLPSTGAILSPASAFLPILAKGINIHPDNPLKLDFIIDSGVESVGSRHAVTEQKDKSFEDESEKLIKYFLASLTTPEDQMWVNLSPDQPDRIIPDTFGKTEMGRDLLAQDYLLKQLTASLMSPDSELGEEFWERVYARTYEVAHVQPRRLSQGIPNDIFSKVWIVPQEALIYEHEKGAFIVKSGLKVMMEEDYMVSLGDADLRIFQNNKISSQLIREVILPELEREVNEGETFANLRQIYHSMLLATWYKNALKDSLIGQVFVDKGKIKGLETIVGEGLVSYRDNKNIELNGRTQDQPLQNVSIDDIYNQYLAAFKTGVSNFIKEEYDVETQQIIPRKYFTGGASFEDTAMIVAKKPDAEILFGIEQVKNRTRNVSFDLAVVGNADIFNQSDRAMSSSGLFNSVNIGDFLINDEEQVFYVLRQNDTSLRLMSSYGEAKSYDKEEIDNSSFQQVDQGKGLVLFSEGQSSVERLVDLYVGIQAIFDEKNSSNPESIYKYAKYGEKSVFYQFKDDVDEILSEMENRDGIGSLNKRERISRALIEWFMTYGNLAKTPYATHYQVVLYTFQRVKERFAKAGTSAEKIEDFPEYVRRIMHFILSCEPDLPGINYKRPFAILERKVLKRSIERFLALSGIQTNGKIDQKFESLVLEGIRKYARVDISSEQVDIAFERLNKFFGSKDDDGKKSEVLFSSLGGNDFVDLSVEFVEELIKQERKLSVDGSSGIKLVKVKGSKVLNTLEQLSNLLEKNKGKKNAWIIGNISASSDGFWLIQLKKLSDFSDFESLRKHYVWLKNKLRIFKDGLFLFAPADIIEFAIDIRKQINLNLDEILQNPNEYCNKVNLQEVLRLIQEGKDRVTKSSVPLNSVIKDLYLKPLQMIDVLRRINDKTIAIRLIELYQALGFYIDVPQFGTSDTAAMAESNVVELSEAARLLLDADLKIVYQNFSTYNDRLYKNTFSAEAKTSAEKISFFIRNTVLPKIMQLTDEDISIIRERYESEEVFNKEMKDLENILELALNFYGGDRKEFGNAIEDLLIELRAILDVGMETYRENGPEEFLKFVDFYFPPPIAPEFVHLFTSFFDKRNEIMAELKEAPITTEKQENAVLLLYKLIDSIIGERKNLNINKKFNKLREIFNALLKSLRKDMRRINGSLLMIKEREQEELADRKKIDKSVPQTKTIQSVLKSLIEKAFKDGFETEAQEESFINFLVEELKGFDFLDVSQMEWILFKKENRDETDSFVLRIVNKWLMYLKTHNEKPGEKRSRAEILGKKTFKSLASFWESPYGEEGQDLEIEIMGLYTITGKVKGIVEGGKKVYVPIALVLIEGNQMIPADDITKITVLDSDTAAMAERSEVEPESLFAEFENLFKSVEPTRMNGPNMLIWDNLGIFNPPEVEFDWEIRDEPKVIGVSKLFYDNEPGKDIWMINFDGEDEITIPREGKIYFKRMVNADSLDDVMRIVRSAFENSLESQAELILLNQERAKPVLEKNSWTGHQNKEAERAIKELSSLNSEIQGIDRNSVSRAVFLKIIRILYKSFGKDWEVRTIDDVRGRNDSTFVKPLFSTSDLDETAFLDVNAYRKLSLNRVEFLYDELTLHFVDDPKDSKKVRVTIRSRHGGLPIKDGYFVCYKSLVDEGIPVLFDDNEDNYNQLSLVFTGKYDLRHFRSKEIVLFPTIQEEASSRQRNVDTAAMAEKDESRRTIQSVLEELISLAQEIDDLKNKNAEFDANVDRLVSDFDFWDIKQMRWILMKRENLSRDIVRFIRRALLDYELRGLMPAFMNSGMKENETSEERKKKFYSLTSFLEAGNVVGKRVRVQRLRGKDLEGKVRIIKRDSGDLVIAVELFLDNREGGIPADQITNITLLDSDTAAMAEEEKNEQANMSLSYVYGKKRKLLGTFGSTIFFEDFLDMKDESIRNVVNSLIKTAGLEGINPNFLRAHSPRVLVAHDTENIDRAGIYSVPGVMLGRKIMIRFLPEFQFPEVMQVSFSPKNIAEIMDADFRIIDLFKVVTYKFTGRKQKRAHIVIHSEKVQDQSSESENPAAPDTAMADAVDEDLNSMYQLDNLKFNGKIKTALIIDDDEKEQKRLVELLRGLDDSIHIITADDGYEGYDILKTSKSEIDIVFTDVKMSRIDGPEMVKMARSDRVIKRITVVFSSKGKISGLTESFDNSTAFHKTLSDDEIIELLSAILKLAKDSKTDQAAMAENSLTSNEPKQPIWRRFDSVDAFREMYYSIKAKMGSKYTPIRIKVFDKQRDVVYETRYVHIDPKYKVVGIDMNPEEINEDDVGWIEMLESDISVDEPEKPDVSDEVMVKVRVIIRQIPSKSSRPAVRAVFEGFENIFGDRDHAISILKKVTPTVESLLLAKVSLSALQYTITAKLELISDRGLGHDVRGILNGLSRQINRDIDNIDEARSLFLKSVDEKYQRESDTAAMAESPGGIDLNPALVNMEVRRNGNGVIIPVMPLDMIDKAMLNGNFEGLIPVNIQVTPITNLPLLLGLDASRSLPHEQYELSYNSELSPMDNKLVYSL